MKVRIEKTFTDKYTGEKREAGSIVDFEDERAAEASGGSAPGCFGSERKRSEPKKTPAKKPAAKAATKKKTSKK